MKKVVCIFHEGQKYKLGSRNTGGGALSNTDLDTLWDAANGLTDNNFATDDDIASLFD